MRLTALSDDGPLELRVRVTLASGQTFDAATSVSVVSPLASRLHADLRPPATEPLIVPRDATVPLAALADDPVVSFQLCRVQQAGAAAPAARVRGSTLLSGGVLGGSDKDEEQLGV